MTKITIFGEQGVKEEKKGIEFVTYISGGGPRDPARLPESFDNVCLLGKDSGMDIIMAWENYWKDAKCIYLGHWNDGIVGE